MDGAAHLSKPHLWLCNVPTETFTPLLSFQTVLCSASPLSKGALLNLCLVLWEVLSLFLPSPPLTGMRETRLKFAGNSSKLANTWNKLSCAPSPVLRRVDLPSLQLVRSECDPASCWVPKALLKAGGTQAASHSAFEQYLISAYHQ